MQSRLSAPSADPGTFRQQKATATGKATSAAADLTTQLIPLPGPNKPSGTNNSGEGVKPSSSTRPVSARGNSQGPEKGIDDIRDLSLEQVKSKKQKERPLFVNNPRKRGAEGELGSLDPPIGGNSMEAMITRPRHGKTLSGIRDVETTRQGALRDDSDYRRDSTVPKQLLLNPDTDSPNTTKVVRRKKQYGHSKPIDRRHPSPEFRSSVQGAGMAEKDNVSPHVQVGHDRPQVQQALSNPNGQGKQLFSFGKDLDDHSSWSSPGDDLHEDEHPEGQEADPEMLLQPETRPISHEQLVVEVKGIYAGLVMVEAKCIDIDEKQSAAAQEKDLSKRPELKNDQWQSLIALHK